MKTRKREIAKAGVFGSVDNPIVVKENDLKEIVETFPEIGKAPLKLGSHWTDDRPRLGNVISVEYDEKTQTLYGEIEEHDTLDLMVGQGYYPDVSIGAKQRASDGKMYLHHLAYLGDEPPAIKDLEDSIEDQLENAENQIAASDKDFKVLPGTNDKKLYLSDTPPNQENPNEKENTLGLGNSAPQPPQPSSPPCGAQDPSPTNKEHSMTKEEIEAMQAENKRLQAEKEAADKLLSDTNAKVHESEKEALKKAAEGKITQGQMENLMNLADTFKDGRTLELSDGQNKKTVSAIQVLTEIFANVPDKVQAGALNLSDTNRVSEPKENLATKMMAHV